MTPEEIGRSIDSLGIGPNSCHRFGAPWRKSPSPPKRSLYEASDETLELLVDHPFTAASERERVQTEIDRRKSA